MKVVVTGSSGHIGGAVARYLLNMGNDVTGISRTRSAALPDAVDQISLDIGAAEFIPCAHERIGACHAVVHAAACLDESLDNAELSRINCLGTQQTIMLAQKLEAASFIYISGFNVLGLPREHPVTEGHPVAPDNVYAATKLYGEYLTRYANSTAMRTVSLRVSSPIGPGLRRCRIARIFIEQALRNQPIVIHGTGLRRQDYVDVRDVASAVAMLLSRQCLDGIINLGSGKAVSSLELAKSCVATTNSTSSIVFSGKADLCDQICWDISIAKAASELGYAPAIPLEVSLADMANGIRRGA